MILGDAYEEWLGSPGYIAFCVANSLDSLLWDALQKRKRLSKAKLKWAGMALMAFADLSERKPEQMQPVFAALYAKRPNASGPDRDAAAAEWLPAFDIGYQAAMERLENRENHQGGSW